jgi:hypothetical protein
MMTRRFLLVGLVLGLSLSARAPRPAARGTELPSRLSDRDFWRLVVDSSERDGYFRSDNLTSNELLYQHVIPDLLRRTRPRAVYLGVGPEQNFTYMAAVRPAFAVIFDIRRGNMLVQLMTRRCSSWPGIAPSSCRCCSRSRGRGRRRSIRRSRSCSPRSDPCRVMRAARPQPEGHSRSVDQDARVAARGADLDGIEYALSRVLLARLRDPLSADL